MVTLGRTLRDLLSSHKNGRENAARKKRLFIVGDDGNERNLRYARAERPLHGDDASAAGPNFLVVCDGVGGSQASSAPLAHTLVVHVVDELLKIEACNTYRAIESSDLLRAVNSAIEQAVGEFEPYPSRSTTLSVAYVDKNTKMMHVVTVGDSKVIVLRKGELAFESTSLVFGFNVPVIISTAPTKHLGPVTTCESINLERGDILFAFSDGVSDNLWLEDIQGIVRRYGKKGAATMARKIAEAAFKQSSKKSSHPFAASAAKCYKEISRQIYSHTRTSESEIHYRVSEILINSGNKKTALDKEIRLSQFAGEHYSQDELQSFANRKFGKSDDISVCALTLG